MRRPPRDPVAPLFTTSFIARSLLQGVVVLAVVAGLFVAALDRLPEEEARALAFAALVATNAGLVLVDRAQGASLVAAFRRPNPALWVVLGVTSAILGTVMLIPAARELFDFGPLHWDDLVVALSAGLLALVTLALLQRVIGPAKA